MTPKDVLCVICRAQPGTPCMVPGDTPYNFTSSPDFHLLRVLAVRTSKRLTNVLLEEGNDRTEQL